MDTGLTPVFLLKAKGVFLSHGAGGSSIPDTPALPARKPRPLAPGAPITALTVDIKKGRDRTDCTLLLETTKSILESTDLDGENTECSLQAALHQKEPK